MSIRSIEDTKKNFDIDLFNKLQDIVFLRNEMDRIEDLLVNTWNELSEIIEVITDCKFPVNAHFYEKVEKRMLKRFNDELNFNEKRIVYIENELKKQKVIN